MAITPSQFGIGTNLPNGATLTTPPAASVGTQAQQMGPAPIKQTSHPTAKPQGTAMGFLDGSSYNSATGSQITPATMPALAPTTSGSPLAQTNKVQPPIVANSDAAKNDLNTINANSQQIGGAMQQQQQVQNANSNANSQAQQQQQQQAAQTQAEAPENQPITAKDLQDALASNQTQQQGGQVTTDANGIQNVTPTAQDNGNQLNQNINDIKDSYSGDINNLQNAENQGLQELAKVSDAQMQAASNVQGQINSVMNGTFPLSSGDQAQLVGLQAQYADLISTAQAATQAYTAGVTAAGIASGRALYTPELNLSLVSQATQSGLQKVQTLTDEGAAAYAKLQSSLQQNDLALITESYKATSDALTARSNAIQKTIDNTKDAITQAYAQQHQDIQDAIQSTQISDSEKKNVFDEAMANAQFTEKQKQDVQDNYFKQQDLSLKRQQVEISQQDVQIKLRQLKDTELGTQLNASNAVQTTGSGNQYVDGTNVDAATQTALLKEGVPVLMGNNAKSMQSITQGQNAFTSLLTSFQQQGIVNAQGQFTKGISTNYIFGQGSQNRGAIKDFNSNISALISDLQKSGDSKVDGSTIADLKANLLSTDSPSADDLNKKLTNIRNALTNSESSLLSNAATGYSVITPDGIQKFTSQGQADAYRKAAGL